MIVSQSIPVEAVRYSATVDGAIELARLAALGARLKARAAIELTEAGWVATVVWSKPSAEKRLHTLHVPLAWGISESRR